jgi:hypothetical protein
MAHDVRMSGVELIEWDAPGPYRVAFSTRRGGVSAGPYASLNVGLLTRDDADAVFENRRLLCEAVGADPARAAMSRQVHGARVTPARPTGVLSPRDHEERDGAWSDEPGLPMLALSADCLPVAICRLEGLPALALVHAGWRGLLAGALAAGARALGDGRRAAVIGPAIGRCCYAVGVEVAGPCRDAFGADVAVAGRLDLRAAAECALRAAGVVRVDHVDRCTACEPDAFFSHRRDRGVTGRQGVIGYVR